MTTKKLIYLGKDQYTNKQQIFFCRIDNTV